MCHIRVRHQHKKKKSIKSKPFFKTQKSPIVVYASHFQVYLKLVDETKVDHVEWFREDWSSLRGKSVDRSSIALTPTPNNASDNSWSPQ